MKKMWSLLTGALLLSLFSLAQTTTVTGKVTDSRNGAPVEGATIVVKGTRIGSATNADGNYSIKAAKGDVLVISSIGYRTREITASDAETNVVLEAASENLTDVVVVGYGSQKKATLSGSQVQLKNADLTRRQVSSATQVLQGLAPGVTVQQQSGRPGADGATIRIRGESSILGNSNPLVVIDGLQMPNSFYCHLW
jgi:hypothetical protein